MSVFEENKKRLLILQGLRKQAAEARREFLTYLTSRGQERTILVLTKKRRGIHQ